MQTLLENKAQVSEQASTLKEKLAASEQALEQARANEALLQQNMLQATNPNPNPDHHPILGFCAKAGMQSIHLNPHDLISLTISPPNFSLTPISNYSSAPYPCAHVQAEHANNAWAAHATSLAEEKATLPMPVPCTLYPSNPKETISFEASYHLNPRLL